MKTRSPRRPKFRRKGTPDEAIPTDETKTVNTEKTVKTPLVDPEEMPMSCQFWYELEQEMRTFVNINIIGFTFAFIKGASSASTKLIAWCTVPIAESPAKSFKPAVQHLIKSWKNEPSFQNTMICAKHPEYQHVNLDGWHPPMWNCIAPDMSSLNADQVLVNYHPFPVNMDNLCPIALQKLYNLVKSHPSESHFVESAPFQSVPPELTSPALNGMVLFAYFPDLADFIKSYYNFAYFNSNPATFPIDDNYDPIYIQNYDSHKAFLYAKMHSFQFSSLMFLDFSPAIPKTFSPFILFSNQPPKLTFEASKKYEKPFPKVDPQNVAAIFKKLTETPGLSNNSPLKKNTKGIFLKPPKVEKQALAKEIPLPSSKVEADGKKNITKKKSYEHFIVSPKGHVKITCPICATNTKYSQSSFRAHVIRAHRNIGGVSCALCFANGENFQVAKLSLFYAHMEKAHASKGNFPCPFCKRRFERDDLRTKHLKFCRERVKVYRAKRKHSSEI